jgi:hypothetical protein
MVAMAMVTIKMPALVAAAVKVDTAWDIAALVAAALDIKVPKVLPQEWGM